MNFYNANESTAAGQVTSCPICGNINIPLGKFCSVCGAELPSAGQSFPVATPAASQGNVVGFAPVSAQPAPEPPQAVFAQGLPAWSIEPPQVMVRRHK